MPPHHNVKNEHVDIVKPNLANERYLQSTHTTPAESSNQSYMEPDQTKQTAKTVTKTNQAVT